MNNKYQFSPNSHNDDIFNTLSSPFVCGLKSKVLADEIFNLVKALLPKDMFIDPTDSSDPNAGRLKPDSVISFGNLGFIEFIDIKEKIVEDITYVNIDPTCTNVPASVSLKRLDLIMTIGYSEVLYNNYENQDPYNSNAILGTLYNFTTIKVEGFAYTDVNADITKYLNPNNYKLEFILTAGPDQYAPVDLPFVGVISSGYVEVIYIGP